MALLQQGGQITNINSQQAANQLGQNFPTPNQPFNPQYGYLPNTAQYPGGYPGYQPMAGGMGYFPIANQLQGTIIYAKVVNGEPIILDPETGEVLPPGYVPEIDNPNTHEGWRPGDSWTETMEKVQAQADEYWRQFLEDAIRPAEEKVVNTISDTVNSIGKSTTEGDNSLSKQVGRNLYNIAPGTGNGYEAPENGMQRAQQRADEIQQQDQQYFQQQQRMLQQQRPNVQQPLQGQRQGFSVIR